MNETLDQHQRIAMTSDEPVVAVAAGPGSGKTRVLVERALYLSDRHESIIILTYTNSGAHEIRERLYGLAVVEFIGTLHSWCFQLLQKFGYLIGYKVGAISILAATERDRVLLDVRDRLAVKISDTKLLSGTRLASDKQTDLIWKEYYFSLKRSGLVDYDKILTDAAHLLNLDIVRQRLGVVDHLLGDEMQDSAVIDWLIYSKIPAINRFYVGDPDQSCFAFRGAYPAGFVEMTKQANTLIRLERNYRSDKLICHCATKLIRHNTVRVDKSVLSVSETMGTVEAHGFDNVYLELEDVAARIRSERPASIAVLCRVNSEVNRCLEYFREDGIPVADRSQRSLPPDWQRALLLVGIAVNPANDILVEQFLRLEFQVTHVNRLKLTAMASGDTLHRASARPVALPTDTPDSLASYLKSNGVSDATVGLVRARAALLASESNLSDLLMELHAHSETPAPIATEEGKVFVGTIHAAKGKEFDVVFLPAFEQGIIPHPITTDNDMPSIEEERRLAFVAITRARYKVFISYATRRKQKWGTVENQPSQFIAEMGVGA